MVDLVEPKPDRGRSATRPAARRLPRRRDAVPAGEVHLARGHHRRTTTARRPYTGDLLEPYRKHIQNGMFHGFDFDVTMLRIAAMNLMLHGVETPDIHYQDTLSNSFPEKFPKQATDGFDVILANPPFKGSLDESDVHPSLTGKVKTKKTELLFVALILRMLKLGGRCACIVPDGVLFGSSKAHVALRKLLVEENQLEAVISLPCGRVQALRRRVDGHPDLHQGRQDRPTSGSTTWRRTASAWTTSGTRSATDWATCPTSGSKWFAREKAKKNDRKAKHFFVPVKEIRDNKYDLSINRYRETEYEEATVRPAPGHHEAAPHVGQGSEPGHGRTGGVAEMTMQLEASIRCRKIGPVIPPSLQGRKGSGFMAWSECPKVESG